MTKQEIEYSVIRHSVSILTSICTGSELKVIDLLTGYLWDEEEAGAIKLPLMTVEPDFEAMGYCPTCGIRSCDCKNEEIKAGTHHVCNCCHKFVPNTGHNCEVDTSFGGE